MKAPTKDQESETMDLTQLKRLLPAIRRMVRFPTKTIATISTELNVEFADLKHWVAEHGRPTQAQLEEFEDQVLETRESARNNYSPPPPLPPVSVPIPPPRKPLVSADPKSLARGRLPAPGQDLGQWLEQQRVAITGRVNCFQVSVTPALAEAWLQFNQNNRKPSRAKIRRFAVAMQAGRWSLNGETLKFSSSGRLIDGQSRLMAIVQAGVAVPLEIRAGLPDQAQESMDSGEARKGAHMLEMLGEANPAILAAALKLAWIWSKGWLSGYPFGSPRVMENGEVAPLLAKCVGLKQSAGWVVSGGAKIDRMLPRSEAAFFHWLFGMADDALRDSFFEALCEGVGLTKVSPVYHLREQLLADRGGPDAEPRKILRRALVIKAWNSAREREHMVKLAWREGESFPEVSGLTNPVRQPAPDRGKNGRHP